MDKPPAGKQDGVADPVSTRIRARIEKANKRYHANDNISAFIEPGELEALLDEVAGKMQGVLESLVIDVQQGSQHAGHGTPRGQDVSERGVPRPLCRASRRSPSFPMPNT